MSTSTPKIDRTDEILRKIAEGTCATTGDDFFRQLTRCLADTMNAKWAFVSEFSDLQTRVKMLAFWDSREYAEPFEYDIEHTPCECVLRGEIGYFPNDVQTTFPLHHELVDLGVESYLAIPMTNGKGDVLGHLAVMHNEPLHIQARDMSIFRIFGTRAAAELERQHASASLQRSEAKLSAILRCAMDAIITVDSQHRITLFNEAAARTFRCNRDWAMGQPIQRFISKRHRDTFAQFVSPEQQSPSSSPAWIPEGLCAVRADGEEFPVEATVSPLQLGNDGYFTLIMRDINERMRSESFLNALQSQNLNLRETIARENEHQQIVGESAAIQNLLAGLTKVASTEATVLITGETGCGKELIAQAIHSSSERAERTLINVNCAALPSELIESELFGHERGAFTGATAQRKGRFELADGGTIFLDEVGELSASAQAKLLRVLQEQNFERVGGTRPITVNVRVIAATNRDLSAMVANGEFRADLFYRLNVFPLIVPPLRERKGDIPLLANHFVEKFARKLGKPLDGIAPVSMERLKRYAWPGNVRELQNVIERAAVLAEGRIIEIPEHLFTQVCIKQAAAVPGNGTLEDISRNHILAVLDAHDWVIEGGHGAAMALGLKPSTLRYRMKLLNISKQQRPRFHPYEQAQSPA